jgi:hypothetical protein
LIPVTAHDTYYIDRDPRPKTKPCHFCARDVEASEACLCVPSQPRSVPGTITLMERVEAIQRKAFALVRPPVSL